MKMSNQSGLNKLNYYGTNLCFNWSQSILVNYELAPSGDDGLSKS